MDGSTLPNQTHQMSYEPIVQGHVSFSQIFKSFVLKDEVSFARTRFSASLQTIDTLVRLFPLNRQYSKFVDKFYDINQDQQLVLAGKNMWLKKRNGKWMLRFVASEFYTGAFTMLIFEDLFDEELIIKKLNSTLRSEYTLGDIESNMECVATIPTIRMSIMTDSPLDIQLDTVQFSETQYTTIGTFTIRGGYDQTEKECLHDTIALLEKSLSLSMCASKIIQLFQLINSTIYDNLVKKGVVENKIPVEPSHITDRFAFGMPIEIGSEEFHRMVNETAQYAEKIYDYYSDEDSDEEEQ